MAELASWNHTATRQAIEEYVASAPADGRVAVFDNDGTLWCEKPMLELPRSPEANGFSTFIASGGDRDFAAGFVTVSVKDDWATVFADTA
jgi:hypothetical protein